LKSIPQDELRAGQKEVHKNKRLVLICNTGVRSYEAQITLDQIGIKGYLQSSRGYCRRQKNGGFAFRKEF